MKQVRVISAQGAVVRGPAKILLSNDQYKRRAHLLGTPKRSGIFHLDGDQALSFKIDEVFGIDAPGRLNRALFDWEEDQPPVDEVGAGAGGDQTQVNPK